MENMSFFRSVLKHVPKTLLSLKIVLTNLGNAAKDIHLIQSL